MNELEKSYHDIGLWKGIIIGFALGGGLAITLILTL
jgi:hypothetical protein